MISQVGRQQSETQEIDDCGTLAGWERKKKR